MTEEEIRVLQEVSDSINFSSYGTADMPEDTIVTEPCFSDVLGSGQAGRRRLTEEGNAVLRVRKSKTMEIIAGIRVKPVSLQFGGK